MHLQQQTRLPHLARVATLAFHLPLRHQRPATPKTDQQQLHKSKLSTATASLPWLATTPNTNACATTHRLSTNAHSALTMLQTATDGPGCLCQTGTKTHHPGIQQPTNQNVHIPNAPAPTSSNIAFNKLVTTARFLHNKTSRNAKIARAWRGRSTNTTICPWPKNSR